jgi:replicative DNA helicase
MSLVKSLKYNIPSSHDVEASFLSAFILDCSLFGQYLEVLDESYFYADLHKKIFLSMKAIFKKNSFFDFNLIKDDLFHNGILTDSVLSYLSDLSENIFSIGLLSSYYPVLKEKKILRDIIFSAQAIIENCYDSENRDVFSIIDKSEKLFLNLMSNHIKHDYVHLDACIKNVFQNIVANSVDQVGGVTGVASGFPSLDVLTSGFQNGDLIIIAARPSMGKTAFALCLARNMALRNDAVGFVSLEMGSDQLAMRILSLDACVQLNALRSGMIFNHDWEKLTDAAARISRYPIYIDDSSLQSVFDLKTKLRKIFLEKKIKVVIVDYLQLLHSSSKLESRHYEVAEISRGLKSLAKELGIPIIALSQLSRQVENRQDKRPMLSDLRDSGAIEQDADLILFLYRDIVYNKETLDPDAVEVIIGKHRNGPTGTVNLKYRKDFTLFEDVSFL